MFLFFINCRASYYLTYYFHDIGYPIIYPIVTFAYRKVKKYPIRSSNWYHYQCAILYHLHGFCQYFILLVISSNISQVPISGCMDITLINSVSTAICFTYINLVVKTVGPGPPYQSNIHPPHTCLTMLPFSAVTNSLQMLATNQVHTQSQTLMSKFSL